MFDSTTQIQTHLIQRGFMHGYECWSEHGEAEHRTNEEQISPADDVMHDVDITTISPTNHELPQTNQSPCPPSQGNTTHDDQQDSVNQMLRESKDNCEDEKLYK